ncbi:MAG: low molecular weight phosphotyrosine protein phosphatase [Clostridia bacterium]|nr:low molecular weight phosphotyrosine protein phosphatase [Clostridia bacterium]
MKECIRVLFICWGNICRSTMAQSVFDYKVNQLGLGHLFEIDSAATSTEEIGNPPHYGTVDMLRQKKIPLIPHRARQMVTKDYDYYDYLIGMDDINIRYMKRIAGEDRDGKMFKLLDFVDDKDKGRNVADPWYTDKFDVTFADVDKGLDGFLKYLKDNGKI